MLNQAIKNAAAPALVDWLGRDPSLIFELDPRQGRVRDLVSGALAANARATTRTYLSGGRLRYAAAGENCIEDGLLSIHPAATNLLPYSAVLQSGTSLDRASWAVDAADAPDGTMTAEALIENTATGEHYFAQAVSGLADDTTYTWSIFVKPKGARPWGCLTFRTKAAAIIRTYFNLTGAGAVGTQGHTGAGIHRLGSTGWYRIWVAHSMANGATTPQVYFGIAEKDADLSYTGDGASGAYLWGRQLEAVAVPSAHIPTDDSMVSRAADGVAIATPAGVLAALGRPFTLRLAGFVPGFSAADAPGNVALFTCGDFAVYWDQAAGAFAAADGVNVAHGPTVALAPGLSYEVVARAQGTSLQVLSRPTGTAAYGAGEAGTYAPGLAPGAAIQIGAAPVAPFQLGRASMLNQWRDNLE